MCFFFFQAEDGIRDRLVTGVQTCALPIYDDHVKEVERLQKELDELNNLKLVDQHGELLLECRIGDEYHQLLLEVGLNTILERFIKGGIKGGIKEDK